MIEHPFRAHVTLIVGGAGYGKTVLATELARSLDVRVGWLSLSREDNDEHRLIEDLRSALRPCLRRGILPAPVDMTDDHLLLERDLAGVETGNCLILDNCEVLVDPACLQVIAEVIAGLPDPCTVVLVGRTTPPIPLGKLRASGMVREIDHTHLRFTRAETAAFFAGLPDVTLESMETQQVHHVTYGWAVGLYLVSVAARAHALTLLTDGDTHPVFHQFVDEYVQQEILGQLSASTREFLLGIIELPTVSIDICERALRIPETARQMATLTDEFPFITPVPGATQRWTWPRMIRESILRITRAEARRATIGPRHRKVIAMLLQEGALREATDYALIGGDPEWIAESVRPWAEHLALRSDFEPLSALMDRLPDAVLQSHPDFLWWRAVSHLGIERYLSVIDWFPTVERTWMESADPLLQGRALVCRTFIDWLSTSHADAIVAADRALEVLPGSAVIERMYASTIRGRVLVRLGDEAGAAASFRDAEGAAVSLPLDEQWAWRTLAIDRANAYALHGDLPSAITKYRLIISELPESLRFLEGAYRCRLISLVIEQGRMDVAWREMEHVERLLEGEWRQWHLWAILARTQLLVAENRLDEAETWATNHIRVMRRMPGKEQLVMLLARIWLLHGEYAMVHSWLSDLDEHTSPWIDAFGEIGHFQLQIDLDLNEGRYADAAARAESLAHAAEESGRVTEWITYALRWAVALFRMEETSRAVAILARTLRRTSAATTLGSFSRIWLVPGFDTAPLLNDARAMAAATRDDGGWTVTHPHTLTKREHEVLHLVARGRTNQQIAEELFISVNTVRNHLVHICRRLDARSRVEAVAKARDLGLLT